MQIRFKNAKKRVNNSIIMANLTEQDRVVLNCIFNPSLPLQEANDLSAEKDLTDVEENTPEIEQSKKMEVDAVHQAEKGNLTEAKRILDTAIGIAPKRASLYNNRAQVLQFEGKTKEALEDISKALDLATEKQQRTICQAFCQRGVILRKLGRNDEARDDFEKAAGLGSMFARNQLIEMNPYAALCNQMLRKAIDELK